MLGVFAKGSTSLFALGIAAIAGLVRRCREMREKLEKSGDDLKTLEEKMTALCTSNEEMRKQRDEAETHFFDQLRKLKQLLPPDAKYAGSSNDQRSNPC